MTSFCVASSDSSNVSLSGTLLSTEASRIKIASRAASLRVFRWSVLPEVGGDLYTSRCTMDSPDGGDVRSGAGKLQEVDSIVAINED